ncbi:hypothetical protein EV426DRAFT_683358 [Tirmania nivea]|nr:hypothetical protein EV426DRAFT_683358 [Tirmania nivea]
MSHPSSLQLEDTRKYSISPMINVIDILPLDYDSIEMEDGEKVPVPLKKALPLEAPVERVTYHSLDVDNLLAPSRSATERAMEGVAVHSILSSKSTLSMSGSASKEFPSPGSEDGEEVEEKKDKEQEKKGKRAQRRKMKRGTKGETEDEVDTNVMKTVGDNLDGFSDVTSSVSYMVMPHPSFNAEREVFTPLDPEHFSIAVSIPLKTGGTFTSPDERPPSRKSNLTQAILELHREAAMVTSEEALVNTKDADKEDAPKKKPPNIQPRPLYQAENIAGLIPSETRATTAMTYTDVHLAEICKSKIDVVNLMRKLLLQPEAKDPSMVPVAPMDPDIRGLLRHPDPPTEQFSGLRKRKGAISTRTVSSAGVETHHLWRDDLSFFSIDVHEDPINHSATPSVSLSPPKIYSPLDGQVDGPRDQSLELLFYPDTAASEPPAEELYCNECQNSKGKCFCYYELRVEKCSICTKGREFCECWPSERLRNSYIRRPLDPTGAREGRRARSGTYVGEVGLAGLGLRIGGVALRGGVDNSWRLKAKNTERGRQRQRESETLMTPLVAPLVETFGSPPKVFGSPPKVSSPLKFEFRDSLTEDEDDAPIETGVDGISAEVESSSPAAVSGGVFMRKRSIHKVEERGLRDKWASGRRIVSPDVRLQDAWMCVCGRCGGTAVCSLTL